MYRGLWASVQGFVIQPPALLQTANVLQHINKLLSAPMAMALDAWADMLVAAVVLRQFVSPDTRL